MGADVPSTDPFWDALADGRFLLRTCSACDETYFPPAPVCPACHSEAVEWTEAAGTGTLYAFTRQHRTARGFDSPILLGTVTLDEGPRLLARLDGDYADLEIGTRVELRPVAYEGGLDRGPRSDAPFFRAVPR